MINTIPNADVELQLTLLVVAHSKHIERGQGEIFVHCKAFVVEQSVLTSSYEEQLDSVPTNHQPTAAEQTDG